MDMTAQKEELLEEKITVNRKLKEQERKKEVLLEEYKKLVDIREQIPTNNDSLKARKSRAKRAVQPAERVNGRARRGSRPDQIHTAARILSKNGLIPIRPSDVEEVIQAVDDSFSDNFAGVYFSSEDAFARIARGQYLYKGE